MRKLIAAIVFAAMLPIVQGNARADIADDCKQSQDPDLAIGACTAAIRSGDWSGENLAWAYNNRGLSYYDLRDYEKSIQDLDQAIRLKPDYHTAFNNRGNSYKELRQYDQAMRDYDQAIQLKSDYATAYYNRGILHRVTGNPGAAVRDYDDAILYRSGFSAAYHNRGNAYEDLGDTRAAMRDWETAIEMEGASRIRWWQEWTRDHGGHYTGAIDGIYGQGTRAALEACARDPNC